MTERVRIQVWKDPVHGRIIKVHYDPYLRNWFFFEPGTAAKKYHVPPEFENDCVVDTIMSNGRKLGHIGVTSETILHAFSEAVQKQEGRL